MISFQPVTLKDKPIIDEFFRAKSYEQSACTFTNLYMWQRCYKIVWAVVDNCLCIQATYGGSTYLLPPFGPDQDSFSAAIGKLEQHYKDQGRQFLIKAVTPDLIEWLEAANPGHFEFRPDRENFDYVYNTRDLIELSGRKYHIKKNHLNKFKKTYSQYEYRAIDASLTKECIEFAVEWCRKRECDPDPALVCERDAIIEVMNNWDYLNVIGGAILIYGKVAAFTFGEMLNPDMAVIHVEKGESDFSGIYQAINQEFCRNAWEHVLLVNREEDMGIPGIRKAKESYFPARMVEKYDVTIKG